MFAAKVHDMIEVTLLCFLLWAIWGCFKSFYRSFLARMFQSYFTKAILKYQFDHWGKSFRKEDLDAVKIAFAVMSELVEDIDVAGPKIRSHALEHGAILYCKTVHLPVHIADPNLYKAIDILKQLFYKMHGTHFDSSDPKCPRNFFQIGVQTKKSGCLPLYFVGRTVQGIMESLRDLRLDDPEDKEGTELVIEMSILTPYTKPGYYYKRYC
jgi:hypothetical protein